MRRYQTAPLKVSNAIAVKDDAANRKLWLRRLGGCLIGLNGASGRARLRDLALRKKQEHCEDTYKFHLPEDSSKHSLRTDWNGALKKTCVAMSNVERANGSLYI